MRKRPSIILAKSGAKLSKFLIQIAATGGIRTIDIYPLALSALSRTGTVIKKTLV